VVEAARVWVQGWRRERRRGRRVRLRREREKIEGLVSYLKLKGYMAPYIYNPERLSP
jgi:hypothetical protein